LSVIAGYEERTLSRLARIYRSTATHPGLWLRRHVRKQ
jgi:hypothetical protein